MAESGSALEGSIPHIVALDHGLASIQDIHLLPVLVIHAHSSCNCRCVMCDIWKTKESKSLGTRDLEPQLDSIRRLGVRWIVFSGGEPLLNPELPALCSALRQENIRLTLLTTGLLLQKSAAEVAASFDDIIVSIDGPREVHDAIRRVPGAFELITAGLQSVRRHCPHIGVSARTTVQKANHCRLRETVRAARELHFDSISFLAADLTSSAFNRPLLWPVNRQDEIALSFAEVDLLQAEMETLIAENVCGGDSGFVLESPEKLRRIVRHFRAQLGLQEAESPLCNAPWVSAVIEVDGNVRPCFFHEVIGNLREGSLESILNSEKGRHFREQLSVPDNSVCRRCVCSLNYRF